MTSIFGQKLKSMSTTNEQSGESQRTKAAKTLAFISASCSDAITTNQHFFVLRKDWMPFADSTAADSHWPMRSLPIWNVPITLFANQAFANQDICQSDCFSVLCQSDICQFLESTRYETFANPICVICQFWHLPISWKPIVAFANQLEANSEI